jgi:hypothetical protein
MKGKAILVLAVLFCALSVYAEEITIFDSNSVIAEGDIYDTVVVKGEGTVVSMTGGTVTTAIAMDSSIFNISGGVVTEIRSYDQSELTLSGGDISYFYPCGESQSTILGSHSFPATLNDSCVVTLSGDLNNEAALHGNSTFNMTGGSVNFIYSTGTPGKKTINISGGSVGGCRAALNVSADAEFNMQRSGRFRVTGMMTLTLRSTWLRDVHIHT